MNIPHRTRRERPDVGKAKAELEQVKRQRPDVEALVAALRREQALNNFTANVQLTFRGGH